MVQHPGLVSPTLGPLPSLCLPHTLHDLQVKLSIGCLTMWNKLMMNIALQVTQNLSCFNFQKSQTAQETGSLYHMNLMAD
jgi:hypothetical protein